MEEGSQRKAQGLSIASDTGPSLGLESHPFSKLVPAVWQAQAPLRKMGYTVQVADTL